MAETAEEIFDYFKEHKPQATLDGIAYWLVEGDLLMDENELWAYAIERAAMDADDQGESRQGLMAATSADKRIIRWRQGKVLAYFVRYSTFPSDAHYQTVVDNMRKATSAWERECGVKFKHLVELDKAANVGPGAALFDVIYVPASQVTEKTKNVLASAFFRDKPKESRHVRVFPSTSRSRNLTRWASFAMSWGMCWASATSKSGWHRRRTAATRSLGWPNRCPPTTPSR